MPAKYSFCEMTDQHLGEVETNWARNIEENISEDLSLVAEGKYERLLAWVRQSIKSAISKEHCFFILKNIADSEYLAIVEMPDASKSKDPSFKLLNIFFSPSLNLEFKEEPTADDLRNITQALVDAIVEATGHAFSNNSKFKMYGRSKEMERVFDLILMSADDNEELLFTVKRESRWLVIEEK